MQVSGIQGGSPESAAVVSNTKSTATYDPKDTNQDGVVSFAEELAYSLKHLGSQTSALSNNSASSQYGQNGAPGVTGLTAASSVDTYV